MRVQFRSFALGLVLSTVVGTARADLIVTGTVDHLQIGARQAPILEILEALKKQWDWLSVPRPTRLDCRRHIHRIIVFDLASAFPGQGLRPPHRAKSFPDRFHLVAVAAAAVPIPPPQVQRGDHARALKSPGHPSRATSASTR